MLSTAVRAAADISAHSCRVWQILAPPSRDSVLCSRLQITSKGSVCEVGGGMAEGGGGKGVAAGSGSAEAWLAPSRAPAAIAAASIRIMVKSPQEVRSVAMNLYYDGYPCEVNPPDRKSLIATQRGSP